MTPEQHNNLIDCISQWGMVISLTISILTAIGGFVLLQRLEAIQVAIEAIQ